MCADVLAVLKLKIHNTHDHEQTKQSIHSDIFCCAGSDSGCCPVYRLSGITSATGGEYRQRHQTADTCRGTDCSSENRSVAELYSTHITDSYIVNTEGERVDANIDPFSVNVSLEVKKPAAERILPVFVCDTKSGVKYIVPVYGAGLWGPIWGYVAFNSDGDTIYGAYFAHQGRLPDLGRKSRNRLSAASFRGKTSSIQRVCSNQSK